MILSKDIQKHVDAIALKLNIPKAVATVAYRSYWMFIKDTIGNLPDLSLVSEQEFNQLKVNFNIPRLGKLTTKH